MNFHLPFSCKITGELESTMLRSFIRAAKLRRWLGKPDCPLAIKECKYLLDKASDCKADDYTESSMDVVTEERAHLATTPPRDLFRLVKRKVIMRARIKYNGVYFARSSTHLGNSLIHFYPSGDRSHSPVPGSIKYIFELDGKISIAIQRQNPALNGLFDPFACYPHFPAKLYSSKLADNLEIIEVEWMMAHFARWPVTSELVVVLSLSRVSSFSNCLYRC